MQTIPLNNGWPIVVDSKIQHLTNRDINEIANLLVTRAVVIFRNQKLSIDDELAFMGQFGDLYSYKMKRPDFVEAICPDSINIANVTGKINAKGLPGLHGGHDDLDWHCNNPWQEDRFPVVYLYAIEGAAGSRTSYTNAILAHKDLNDEWRERIRQIRLRVGMIYNNYSKFGEHFGMPETENQTYHPTIHQVNPGHKDVLYFPFLQIFGLYGYENRKEEEAEIINYLKCFMLQEKYIYHHDWKDGDVVIADQWSGVHKRWAFPGMSTRLLHRIVTNYNKVELNVQKP